MSDREAYFRRARDWAADTRAESVRSRRIAWTVAGIAVSAALFEAVALAMLAPLKSVEPVTILVDRQTGYVQAIDPLTPHRIAADDALTNSYLAQYVAAREGFDRATILRDYRRVALWSSGAARRAYLGIMPATNPASPFQRYPAGTIVSTEVKSVSRLNVGTALVRFDTQVEGQGGTAGARQPWISVVRFRYVDAPMAVADRLVNPLGFQVTGYRRNAEATPPTAPSNGINAPTASAPPVATSQTVAPPVARRSYRSSGTNEGPNERRTSEIRPLTSLGAGAGRNTANVRAIPVDQLPLGSPLSPGPGTGRRPMVPDTSR